MSGSLGTYFKNVGGLTPSRFVSSDSAGNLEEKTAAEVCTLLGLGPVFSVHPSDQSAFETQTITFAATSTAIVGTVTYQWQRQALGVGSWSNISGATSSGYTTPTLTVASNNGDKYRRVDSNGLTTTTSNAATITVAAVPLLRYGVSSPVSKGTTASANVCWFPLSPCRQAGTITEFKAYFATSGAFKIAVLRRNGYTFDRVHLTSNITAASGLNTFTSADFGTITVQSGDLVGFIGSVGRLSYTDSDSFGVYSAYMSGDPAASGNALIFSPSVRNWQYSYKVSGIVSISDTLINEPFTTTTIPWEWELTAGAWTYDGTKATSGTAGIANSLNYRMSLGNLSQWTWSADFTFDTVGARFAMITRNAIQSTAGFAIEINSSTNNLVVYRTSTGNGWTDSGALSAVVTQATGLTLATATTYRMTITKSFRSAIVTITDVATPANTYTLSWNQEDATVAPTYGFGYGKPGLASVSGTISVLSTTFAVPTARPDYLFIGDSITEGSGVTSSTLTMARLLATDLSASILTSAQGGASTLHAPTRLACEMAHIFPKRVHFMLGTNDTVVADWKNKVGGMRDWLNGMCDSVIVGSVPAEAADSNPEVEFNPYIQAQGWETVRHDLALTSPATGLGANRNAALYYDTLHPNSKGHSAMRTRFRSDLGV